MPVIEAIVASADAGRKLKYYLRSDLMLSYHSVSELKSGGGLTVNGEAAHANYILREGDRIRVELREQSAAKIVIPEALPVQLVYQDADLMILDKPAPLACQATPKQPTGTLENRLAALADANTPFVFRPLNRLDKGTSGLMAAARHAHACQLMQRQLHTDSFVREYLAVSEGVLEGEGVIDAPIAKEAAATIRRVIDPENGQSARTHYRALESDGRRTLIRLRLESGRTHQIRVHLSSIGHPIVGDFLYGTEDDALPGRFALHSAYIAFDQPMTGRRIERTSPLPDALKGLLNRHD